MRLVPLSLLLIGLAAAPARGRTGALAGHVVDMESGQAVGWTTVVIEGLDRARTSNAGGYFFFANVPSGVHTVRSLRIGYHEARFEVEVIAGDTTHVDLQMGHETLEVSAVIVEGERIHLSPLQEPEVVFSSAKLRQNLSRTIAETIDYEPGIAQRSMGPAPARPVLRGLGGDRLLVLEDGERTGDLSATSSDHAVAIEPMTTERIEVVRGPRTLLHGSNALAGVVNVVRGYVPSELPAGPRGSLTWQGESVNRGLAGGLALEHALGPVAVRADGSLRDARAIGTPRGELPNTGIRTGNTSVGAGMVGPWGHAGVSGSLYDSDYGIPPAPEGGGHEEGVDIELLREHLEARGEILAGPAWLQRLELHHSFSRYQHGEYEADGSLGMEFGVLSHHGGALAHLKPLGPMADGAAGVWYEYRNYAAAGLNFTPPADEYAGALYTYQETEAGPWSASAALRFDARRVEPREERDSRTVGRIRRRDFAGFSAGLSSHYRATPSLTLGSTVMRTFRAPGIEELFSEGPHLAAYSYEVGNGSLGTERGLGLEVFAEFRKQDGQIQLAFFRNAIDGYIFPKNTGERSLRRADLFRYKMVGEPVLMHGAEAAFDWRLARVWKGAGTLSYVRGRLTGLDDEPLPQLPPLQGRFTLAWEPSEALKAGAALRLAADQDRPGEFEKPTGGYAVLDLSGEHHVHWRGRLHTLSLTLENATDAVYRNHLNRVKEFLPEPGRNLRLLHKVFF